jgi:hypothetical protein
MEEEGYGQNNLERDQSTHIGRKHGKKAFSLAFKNNGKNANFFIKIKVHILYYTYFFNIIFFCRCVNLQTIFSSFSSSHQFSSIPIVNHHSGIFCCLLAHQQGHSSQEFAVTAQP